MKNLSNQVKLTKKAFFFTAIIAVFFLSFSCKKSKTTTVSGVIIDATNNNKIAGARILLLSESSEMFSNAGSKTENSYYADNSGNYSFTFEAEDSKFYSIAPDKEKYYELFSNVYPNSQNIYDLNKYSKNNITLKLKPKSFIKVHAKKTDPNSKSLVVQYSGFECFSKDTFYFLIELLGNQNNKLYRIINYNDGSYKKIDNSYFCPPLDTLTININY